MGTEAGQLFQFPKKVVPLKNIIEKINKKITLTNNRYESLSEESNSDIDNITQDTRGTTRKRVNGKKRKIAKEENHI